MRRGRRVRLDGDALVAARVCGPLAGPAAHAFDAARALRDLLSSGESVRPQVRTLLAPGASRAPVASRTLCVCHGVREADARRALAAGDGDAQARLLRAQASTKCGTGCGSCLPELRALARDAAGAADAARSASGPDAARSGRVAA
jgi:assimilatory nitrate reductase catalytic subunit